MIPSEQVTRLDGTADLARVRSLVRSLAKAVELTTFQETHALTVASELARNAIQHGGGGRMTIRVVQRDGRRGLLMVFEDDGPGIAEPERSMVDGYSTVRGMGVGLGGSRRLADDFRIEARPEGGTKITATVFSRRKAP